MSQNLQCRRAWEAWILTKASDSPVTAMPVNLEPSSDSDSDITMAGSIRVSTPSINHISDDTTYAEITPNNAPLYNPYQARVEDAPDEDDDITMCWIEEHPRAAGKVLGVGETTFERWRREDAKAGRDRWFPFDSEKEWHLGRWLVKNAGQNQIEEFLKLAIVCGVHQSFSDHLLMHEHRLEILS